jgi:hypothetical protein
MNNNDFNLEADLYDNDMLSDPEMDMIINFSDTELLSIVLETPACAAGLYLRQIDQVSRFLELATSTRVLFPLGEVLKVSQLHLILNIYRTSHIKRFRRNLRVNPETFDALVDLIEDDPIFHSDNNNQQLPVRYQLAIALYRFGHFGNAASVESIAQWAGCSAGTVFSCTRRVMVAITGLHDDAFTILPEHIANAKAWVARESCYAWRNGWCMADGTLVPLSDKPGHHGEAYFDRKSNYSLNVLVSDHYSCSWLVFSLSDSRSSTLGTPGCQHSAVSDYRLCRGSNWQYA